MIARVRHVLVDLRRFPAQLWLLVLGTFVFNLAIGIGMPFETIYLTDTRHISPGTTGAIWTFSALVSLPMLIVSGALADRRGRRLLLAISVCAVIFFYLGMAVSHVVWQFVLITTVEGFFGWPMFLTASNSMIADLVLPERRPEAYGLLRAAMSAGIVFGPLIAALALDHGATYPLLFLAAASGCAVFLVIIVVWIGETRHLALPVAQHLEYVDEGSLRGYRRVFSDRHFLAFSGAAVLTLFAYGQFLWIFPLFLRQVLNAPASDWGLLLFLNGLVLTTLQYPLVRLAKRTAPLYAMAWSGVLIAVGVGAIAFATAPWQAVPLVIVFSLGEAILWPISSTVIAGLAPAELRGRYTGAWTIVDCGGRGLGPFFGGFGMDRFGARRTFVGIMGLGLLGAALFPALQRREQRRPQQPIE